MISLSSSDAHQTNSSIRHYWTPVLRRQMYMHLKGFCASQLILFKIRIRFRNNIVCDQIAQSIQNLYSLTNIVSAIKSKL